MRSIATGIIAAALAFVAASPAVRAQTYQDDLYCRQYADQAVAPMRQQAGADSVGSTLLGAGVGAAIGGAIGGGRGAAIGAGSGALAGAASAQASAAQIQQYYSSYYYSCMQSRRGGGYPQPGYQPPPQQPAYPGYR